MPVALFLVSGGVFELKGQSCEAPGDVPCEKARCGERLIHPHLIFTMVVTLIPILQMRKPRLRAEKDTCSRAHSQETAHSPGFTQECVPKWRPLHASPARHRVWGTIKMEGERGILAGASELEGTSRRAAKLSLCFTKGETQVLVGK